MQSKEPNARTEGCVTHPTPEEWMAYLYDETEPERKGQLQSHLASCPECAQQVQDWRGAQVDLDRWVIPSIRTSRRRLFSDRLAWAAAAVLVLGAFFMGRLTSPAQAELNEIKATVAALASARPEAAGTSNAVYVARVAAREEALQLFADFVALQDEQRQSDREEVQRALANFDTRLKRVRSELETVAVNTFNGFEQTHRNLTRLASYSASGGDNSRANN